MNLQSRVLCRDPLKLLINLNILKIDPIPTPKPVFNDLALAVKPCYTTAEGCKVLRIDPVKKEIFITSTSIFEKNAMAFNNHFFLDS